MKKFYVVASGGIDSGITTQVLKEAGFNVEMIHFVYGQRSWLAELYSVLKLSKALEVPLKVFDLTPLYKAMGAEHVSFLMDPNAPVYSGLKELKKSVAAWVPGRNMLFATITATYAESQMLQNPDIEKAFIAAGWAQLSECIVADEDQLVLVDCNVNGTHHKPITEIKPGDKLFLDKCESPHEVYTVVKKVAERVIDSYQYLRVRVYTDIYDSNRYFDKTIKVGPEHKFIKHDETIKAKDLKPGMTFTDPFDPWTTYEVLENLTIRKPARAIDLYCEPHHGFYLNGVYTCNSGSYPDNSERFNDALEHLYKFGLVKGHDIHMTNVLSDIMKYEEWLLGEALGFPFEYTCSCDNPRVIWKSKTIQQELESNTFQELKSKLSNIDELVDYIERIELCIECGSTRNSRWAAAFANVKDPRHFYESKAHPKGYNPYEIEVKPKFRIDEEKRSALVDIINRLNIDEVGKRNLAKKLGLEV